MSKLYFDGGCSPNPGMMHACIVLDGVASFQRLGKGTNNAARSGLRCCWGLSVAIEQGITELDAYGDSHIRSSIKP